MTWACCLACENSTFQRLIMVNCQMEISFCRYPLSLLLRCYCLKILFLLLIVVIVTIVTVISRHCCHCQGDSKCFHFDFHDFQHAAVLKTTNFTGDFANLPP